MVTVAAPCAARAQHRTLQCALLQVSRGAPSKSGSTYHAGAGRDGVVVSWATGNAVILDEAPQNASLPEIGSAVRCSSAPSLCILSESINDSPWLPVLSTTAS